ncbi:hypothetical protein N8J89_13625 [Crossiella sp. CA-258035]|uniref:STAS domain-containing protein n=1 Tax=Crossiella sp. CA-258035 TaxID=2981138 RepID=UPI0024BC59DB|nr:STAS domain-containing protein [Crossiella sp. CA-258035]WHT22057.1 hypothetical protein N8J89_13625 [Crossiella sp. CA-258035]
MTGPSPLRLITWSRRHLAVVQPMGRLDLSTHHRLLDGLLKVAAEEPGALVVNLARLEVGPAHGVGVFYRVWQRVNEWPGIPMAMVAPEPELREVLLRGVLSKVMPVCATLTEAVRVCRAPPAVRQREVHLPGGDISALRARLFVTDACLDWGGHEVLGDALLIIDELVASAVAEGSPEVWVRVRLRGNRLSLSVRDRVPGTTPPAPAAVGQLALSHGRTPSVGGKICWAVLGLP